MYPTIDLSNDVFIFNAGSANYGKNLSPGACVARLAIVSIEFSEAFSLHVLARGGCVDYWHLRTEVYMAYAEYPV
jgi:hypothetical protein